MKLKLTDNLFLKVLSVLVAVVLWLVVVNISDAKTSGKYTVGVTLLNTEVITDNGKVFRVEDGTDSVRLTVRARGSVLKELKSTDFILTADMEKDLKYDSLVGITVECKNSNINVDEDITLSRSNVKVSIEDSATEQFPIKVTYTGSPNSGLVVGSLVPEQTVIKVTGPVSIVEKIKKVEAVVDITGIPGTSVRNCALKFYDGADNPIDSTYLNYTGKSDGIDVTVSMLNTKSIPLIFSYSGIPAENYEVKSIEWKPEYIEIAGNSSVLAGITSLQIPEDAVNVDGIDEELQLVVDITPYLPSGLILTDGDSAAVLVIIELEYVEPEEEEEAEEENNNSEEESGEDNKPEEEDKSEETDNSKEDTTTETQKPSENTADNKAGSTGTDNSIKGGLNTDDSTSAGTNSGVNQNNNNGTERGENDKTESNS